VQVFVVRVDALNGFLIGRSGEEEEEEEEGEEEEAVMVIPRWRVDTCAPF